MFCIDGNLYGRRTAGATYRNELESIICETFKTDEAGFQFQFVRGDTDSTIYRCARARGVLLHHVDDDRVFRPTNHLTKLRTFLKNHLGLKSARELEVPGTKSKILGRTKIRPEDALYTLPDPKRAENIITILGLERAKPASVPGKS